MAKARSAPDVLKRLVSKARRGPGAVNPEDLLPLAAASDPAMALQLRTLAREWPHRGRIDGSAARVVPLGRWAEYVCAALERGPAGVVALARTAEERELDAEDGADEATFALGVLAEIRTEESIRAVLMLAADAAADLEGRRALAVACAGALNDLTAFKDAVRVSDETAAAARAFLHALLARPLSTADMATACLALRGVGDAASLDLVGRIPALPPPWADTANVTTRAIRARLRANGA